MSTYFATMFPNEASARVGQRIVEGHDGSKLLNLAASVVIVKNDDGEIIRHHSEKPGAVGTAMSALIGGIVGLAGGPAVTLMGAAAGALSGGWFDFLQESQRREFMNEVAVRLNTKNAALLGEVIDPSDEAKQAVEAELAQLGGTLVRSDA